ncbi:hypothetical protein BDK51DRAFT_50107 [Blyttiomyces helicus]|uniref:Glycosyl hydrolases family 2 sugar binding domain-containing protein n=1 Tax=Blyttiomyces helicus TaxID=388810 RepID=A0A4V1IRM8_9FUNG|nr:hypothetical protein BDK51DRAFT_50107 [Blyttiomyces helicus]|eukprot:RKO90607.1 hypothetical protein BDK51DRAFT_50107 [Blyttiomyces helicus]
MHPETHTEAHPETLTEMVPASASGLSTETPAPLTNGTIITATNAFNLGIFGVSPWGSASQFYDPTAYWIWSVPTAATAAPAGTVTFANQYYNSSNFTIPAVLHILADNNAVVVLNGVIVGTAAGGWTTPSYTQLPLSLTPGNNSISIVATNAGGPAGLCAALISGVNKSVLLHTDNTWTLPSAPVQLSGTNSFKLGTFGVRPWGSTSNFADPTASWIWNTPTAASSAPAGSVTFANQYYNSSNSIIPAVLHILADNNATISVNGISVGTATAGWATTSYTKLPVNLTAGNNLFSIVVTNAGGPAGLCASLMSSNNSVLLHTDSTWISTPAPVQLTGTPVFNLGNFGMLPWGSTSKFADTTASWIWNTTTAAQNAPAGSVTFVNQYYNSSNNTISATLHILADDSATIFVNGTNIGTATAGWAITSYTQLPVNLTPGSNLISIVATNASGPAGLCASLISSSNSVLLHTDATWLSK